LVDLVASRFITGGPLWYSAENRLLLACVGPGVKGNYSRLRALLNEPLDWDYTIRTAQENGIAPLLRHLLMKGKASDRVPVRAWKELQRIYHFTGFCNALLYRDLEHLLRAFAEAGIPVIVLKGAALAATVWENIALRPMSDIDLLIPEEDSSRADRVLTRENYVSGDLRRSRDWYSAHHHHLAPYHKADSHTIVEVHRGIVVPDAGFTLDMQGIRDRAQAAKIGDVDTLVLCPEDLITHLCLHVSADDPFAGKIRNLGDICRVIKDPRMEINWKIFADRAVKGNFARYAYYPLYLVDDLFHVSVDKNTLKLLRRASGTGSLADRAIKAVIERGLIRKSEVDSILPNWLLASVCEEMLSRKAMSRKIASLMRLAVRPPQGLKEAPSHAAGRLGYACYPAARLCRMFARLIRILPRAVSQRAGILP